MHYLALLCLLWAGGLSSSFATPTNIFSTQFEFAQGYNPNLNLAGQNSWTKFGSGGNGLTNGFFAGQGQQAYVGRFPPATGDSTLFVWRPINFTPVAAGLPLVTFTTLMSIVGSTNGESDYFQWQVINNQAQPLIVIDFDVYATNVGYFRDGTQYVDTGVKFGLGASYTLTVTMNFASNRWSATLNSTLLAANQPITTTGKQLTLGDVDAVWDLYATNAPGNNFMVFDNYTITADALTPPPRPRLFAPRYGRSFNLTFPTQSNFVYTVEFANQVHPSNWTALTNLVGNGQVCDIRDYTATNNARYYRVRTEAGAARPTVAVVGFGKRFSFSLSTLAGATYLVDCSSQLQAPVWTLLHTFKGDGSVMTFVDDAASGPARFYRLRIE